MTIKDAAATVSYIGYPVPADCPQFVRDRIAAGVAAAYPAALIAPYTGDPDRDRVIYDTVAGTETAEDCPDIVATITAAAFRLTPRITWRDLPAGEDPAAALADNTAWRIALSLYDGQPGLHQFIRTGAITGGDYGTGRVSLWRELQDICDRLPLNERQPVRDLTAYILAAGVRGPVADWCPVAL